MLRATVNWQLPVWVTMLVELGVERPLFVQVMRQRRLPVRPILTADTTVTLDGNILGKPEMLAKLGYYPLVESEKPEGDYRATYALVDGSVVQSWEAYTPAPVVHTWSKYKIMQTVIALGKLGDFNAAMTDEVRALWDSATNIRSDDAWFAAAKPGLVAALGITEAQADEMLEGCKI